MTAPPFGGGQGRAGRELADSGSFLLLLVLLSAALAVVLMVAHWLGG